MKPLTITFDDIIYNLQKSGGASVYWQEMTSRIEKLISTNAIDKITGHTFGRMIPQYVKTSIFHSSHFRFAWNKNAKNVSTVYDMTYELGMVKSKGAFLNILERKISYFTADALICISENTKKDLLEIYPTLLNRCPIHVVHLGCSLSDYGTVSAVTASEPRIHQGAYVLYVGGRNNYKNFDAALLGFQLSGLQQHGFTFLCTGSAFSDEEQANIRSLGLEDAVRVICNVSTSQMIQLYQSAFCMVYPSKYEGFGLPPIEAMHFGCPVIAANRSSIPEVVGQAAWLIDPDEPHEIATALIGLTDASLRHDFIQKGLHQATLFSWDITANKHLDIYKSLL